MNSLDELLDAYDGWVIDRQGLAERDGGPDTPHADEWHGSDDTAVELLDAIVALLKEGSR